MSAEGGQLKLGGDLTTASTPALLEQGRARIAAAQGALELDLSAVTRSDSSGLALVVDWIRTARRQGRDLSVTGAPEQLTSIAEVSGLVTLLDGGTQGAP